MANGASSPQRALIDRIRAEFGLNPGTGDVSNSRAFNNLERAVRILSEQLNTELAHFLHELVQNADDLKYESDTHPSLIFRLRGNSLLVISNERGFSERDVESICSVGDSTKAGNADTTGEKGIGFKSLFKAAEEVTISSGGYHFQFSMSRRCGIVVPEWKNLPQEYQLQQYSDKTLLLLKFANNKKLEKIKSELLAFDSKLLLFLRRLRVVEIEIEGKATRVERHDTGTDVHQTTTLSTCRDSAAAVTSEFAIVPYTFPVNVDDDARRHCTSTTVTLVFPLGKFDGVCHAYNCLPICSTGFPFLLQADFILSASREGLNESHSEWNDSLITGLSEAFLQAAKSRFNTQSQLQYIWPKYLPCNAPHSQLKRLASLIQLKLKNEKVLLTQSGNLCVPSLAFHVPKVWRDEENQPLIEQSGLTAPSVSTEYGGEVFSQLRWLGCRTPDSHTLWTRFRDYLTNDNGISFRSQSMIRLSSFAKALLPFELKQLQTLPIIPVQNEKWVAAQGRHVFFEQSDSEASFVLKMPRGLPEVDIVRSEFLETPSLKTLFKHLGVIQSTVTEVCRMLRKAHTKAAPPSYDPDILIEQVLYLFRAIQAGKAPPYDPSPRSLWLCTKSGKPVLSRFMYQPAALMEKIVLEHIGHSTTSRQLMNAAYLTYVEPTSHKAFSKWLLDQYKVLTWLRFCDTDEDGKQTQQQTAEFLKLLDSQNCDNFLSLIVNSWHQNFGSSSGLAFMSSCSSMNAYWASNRTARVRLDSTFLPSKEIRSLAPADVPFLKIQDADNSKWQILRHLNVITKASTTDPRFWLACLRSLMEGQPNVATLEDVYGHLNDMCAKRGNGIKAFFEENTAIFIPSKGTWVKSTECIWSSECSLRRKCILSIEYSLELERLFRLCVGIRNAQIDDIIAEIKLWSVKEDQDLSYLKRLFSALPSTYKAVSQNLRAGLARQKLKALQDVNFVPVVKGSGSKTIRQAVSFNFSPESPEWYVVDSSRFQDAFREQVWLLDFSIEESQKLRPFLASLKEVLGSVRPGLAKVVRETSSHEGESVASARLTQLIRSRSNYFGSIARTATQATRTDLDTKINRLANAQVFCTEKIITSLTIASNKVAGTFIQGSTRMDSKIMLEEAGQNLDVFLLGRADSDLRIPVQAADVLGSYLGVTSFEYLYLISQMLMVENLNDVRDILVLRGIEVKISDNDEADPAPPTNALFTAPPAPAVQDDGPATIMVDTPSVKPEIDPPTGAVHDTGPAMSVVDTPSIKPEVDSPIGAVHDTEQPVSAVDTPSIKPEVDSPTGAAHSSESGHTGLPGSPIDDLKESDAPLQGQTTTASPSRSSTRARQPSTPTTRPSSDAQMHNSPRLPSVSLQLSTPAINGSSSHLPGLSQKRSFATYASDTDPAAVASSGPRRNEPVSRSVEVTAPQQQDLQTGIQGELFVYKLLKSVLQQEFNEDNWTSELRYFADPELKEWKPANVTTFYADFTFVDEKRTLAGWLHQRGVPKPEPGRAVLPVRYNIEVKATTSRAEDPFHMSDWQFEEMKRMASRPLGSTPRGVTMEDKFMVFRVSGLGKEPNLEILSDLWQAYVDGRYSVRSPSGMWMVRR